MPNFIKNLGIDALFETEAETMNFIAYLTEKGKVIEGYLGCPVIFTPLGDIDFFVKTQKNDNGKLEICGIDTHCCGMNIWQMRNTGIDITPADSLLIEKVFMFQDNKSGSGLVPIHIINADVLPSFLKDDVINMQMCGFPLDINYYRDEDDYAEHQTMEKDGEKCLLADGVLLPLHFLSNHSIESDTEETDYSTDEVVAFRGTVKALYNGVFQIEGNKYRTYIRCIIETVYGELQLAHTLYQVDPCQRENLEIGSVVSGLCVLSGDAAINEYTQGVVKNAETNLRLIKQVVYKGCAERMRSVLTKESKYISEVSGITAEGPDAIINRFNYIYSARRTECFVSMATITQIDSEELKYPAGTRCAVISYGEEHKFDSIIFVDLNETGDIEQIYVTKDCRYRFDIDSPC